VLDVIYSNAVPSTDFLTAVLLYSINVVPSTNSFVILLTAILLYEHLKHTSYAYKLYNPSEVPTQSQLAMGGLTVKPLYFVNVGQLPLMTPTSSEIIRNAV